MYARCTAKERIGGEAAICSLAASDAENSIADCFQSGARAGRPVCDSTQIAGSSVMVPLTKYRAHRCIHPTATSCTDPPKCRLSVRPRSADFA